MAEPADRDDRMANGLADSEAAPEQRHHLGAGIVGAFARFGNMDRPALVGGDPCRLPRSEEHTSELQSLMRISYAVFCLKKKKTKPSNADKAHSHNYEEHNRINQ